MDRFVRIVNSPWQSAIKAAMARAVNAITGDYQPYLPPWHFAGLPRSTTFYRRNVNTFGIPSAARFRLGPPPRPINGTYSKD